MRWPGLGDPRKRRKTIRFLIILLMVGVAVGVASSVLQGFLGQGDPLKVCINNRDTPYKITATLELNVDGNKADIPANIGFDNVEEDGLFDSVCQRTLYTITDDGVIHVEWEEEYPFEIGHFLWIWDFPLKDMDLSKSRIVVNGVESKLFINEPLVQGYHYKAEFTSKDHEESKDTDFLPPDL
tara:strand:- start:609 stop:1157 length:549 start_codon:yes stop_codon:yes gene_type:complete